LNFHPQPKQWPFSGRLADGIVIAAVEAGHDPDPFLRQVFASVCGKRLVERSETDEIGEPNSQPSGCVGTDVFGSPAYVLDGEVFWGQNRIELLVDALKSARPPFHSQV
jgi:hypothetical protein